jgi:hypothetical protein
MANLNKSKLIPASSFQSRLFFLQEREPDAFKSNTVFIDEISGVDNADIIQRALVGIVAEHEIFRTTFLTHDGKVFQNILNEEECLGRCELVDLTSFKSSEKSQIQSDLIDAFSRVPFDLSLGPCFRFRLYKIESDKFILQRVLHHIICDWDSAVTIFINQLRGYISEPEMAVTARGESK